ncbi:MAG: hypothetical protein WA821_13235 [Anaerolineales bacterium]
MLKKSFSFIFWIMLVELLTLTACGASITNQNVSVQSSDGTAMVIPNAGNSSSNQDAGSSEPGGVGDGHQSETGGTTQPLSGKTTLYKDVMYKFSVAYPSEFKFGIQPAEKLAGLNPKPIVSFIFINPGAASSDIAELEPADLEVRIYDAAGETSLDRWLTSVGLTSGSNSQPFQTANVSGIKLCSSTMIAPGCSFFVISNIGIYQLRPTSLEGEDMIKSFMLVP